MDGEGTILIVDDNPANLGVLFDSLEEVGFRVLVATDGEAALAGIGQVQPDIVLLDVRMPGIDGFETCRRLKADEATRDIPIIFMTALTDPVDEVRGLELGAVDYITKPIRVETALARVNTHLTIRNLQRSLQEQNAELAAYDRTVAHGLKISLAVVIEYAELLEENIATMSDERVRECLHAIAQSGRKMRSIIDKLLVLATVREVDEVDVGPVDMVGVVAEARDRLADSIEGYGTEIVSPERWPVAMGLSVGGGGVGQLYRQRHRVWWKATARGTGRRADRRFAPRNGVFLGARRRSRSDGGGAGSVVRTL